MTDNERDEPLLSPGEDSPPEGSGESLAWDPESGTRPNLADVRLKRRAVREGWDVPPELLSLVPREMGRIVKKSKSVRGKVAAAKVLVSIVQQSNQKSSENPPGSGATVIIVPPGMSMDEIPEVDGPGPLVVLPDNGRGLPVGDNTFFQMPDGTLRATT